VNFQEKLSNYIERKKSVLCIGLDTVLEKIPPCLRAQKNALFIFNKMIIDATADFAVAYKINTAFYEAYGIEGWRALKATFKYLSSDVIKIADAKRGDIGNTSVMYANALFKELGADAITVNPLMGFDSVQPFLQYPEKGVFFLCLTSNSGSQDFQYFSDGRTTLYQRIASKVQEWNTQLNCGLVVGATHPEELSMVRDIADVPFLIPGIGAQGGELELAVRFGTDIEGNGALFNSSRAIIYASSEDDFAQIARKEAQKVNEEINKIREKKRSK
jgi:orotidine-5'-phosphate decarboxylase